MLCFPGADSPIGSVTRTLTGRKPNCLHACESLERHEINLDGRPLYLCLFEVKGELFILVSRAK